MSFESYVDSNTGITIVVSTQAPDALPIGKNLELSTNWQEVITVPQFKVPELVFGGSTTMKKEQKEQIRKIINLKKSGNNLDYVTGWFLKAEQYIDEQTPIGFVATNSINQGEQAGHLWNLL